MKLSLLAPAVVALALASAAWLSSAAKPADTAPVDYTFRELPLGSMGVKSLAELRGKPVLIDFWGQH